jgi:hypothetical protein
MPTHAEAFVAIARGIDPRSAAKTHEDPADLDHFHRRPTRWLESNDIHDSTMRRVLEVDDELVKGGDKRPYEQRCDLALRVARGEPSPYAGWGEIVQLGGIGSPGDPLHDQGEAMIRIVRTRSWAVPEPEPYPCETHGIIGEMAEARGGRRAERASDGVVRWQALE